MDAGALGAGAGDETVTHADLRLRHDVERVSAQEVVVLVYGPRERVLDGDGAACRLARLHGPEQLLETRAGHEPDVRPQRLERRGMAERAGLPLNGDRNRCHVSSDTPARRDRQAEPQNAKPGADCSPGWPIG